MVATIPVCGFDCSLTFNHAATLGPRVPPGDPPKANRGFRKNTSQSLGVLCCVDHTMAHLTSRLGLEWSATAGGAP